MIKMLFALVFFFSVTAAAESAVFSVQTELSVTTTSSQALPKNQDRKYLLILNKGSANVIVKFGSAHSASEGVLVPAGGNYEPFVSPIDSVYLKAASGTQTVLVIEGK